MRVVQPRGVFACFAVVGALFCVTQIARAQEADALVLKTYNVGDLLQESRDYSADQSPGAPGGAAFGAMMGSGGGGGGGGALMAHQVGSSTTIVTIDALRDLMVSVVYPDSWEEVGGSACIEQLGTSLVVLQSAEAHESIDDLLAQLENAGVRNTVTVDARWLMLDSDDLERLSSPDQGTLDREALSEFTRRPSSIRAITNCFSGQAVYVISGTERNIVSGYVPVVGSVKDPSEARFAHNENTRFHFVQQRGFSGGGMGGMGGGGMGGMGGGAPARESNVGYQPQMKTANYGAELTIRPTVHRNGTSAVVDLTSMITAPGDGALQSQDGFASPPPPIVQPYSIETQRLSTTMRVPIGEPVLVGGMTFEPAAAAPEAMAGEEDSSEESRQLYLVLELNVR